MRGSVRVASGCGNRRSPRARSSPAATSFFVHVHARKRLRVQPLRGRRDRCQGPVRVLPKTRWRLRACLLSWVITAKFGDHLPHYRLGPMLAREGVSLSCDALQPDPRMRRAAVPDHRRDLAADSSPSGDVQADDTSKRIQLCHGWQALASTTHGLHASGRQDLVRLHGDVRAASLPRLCSRISRAMPRRLAQGYDGQAVHKCQAQPRLNPGGAGSCRPLLSHGA